MFCCLSYLLVHGIVVDWVFAVLQMLVLNIPFLTLITIHYIAECNGTANFDILLGCPSRVVLLSPSSGIAYYIFTLGISAVASDTLLLFMLIGIRYSDISGSRDPWVEPPLGMLISNIPFLALITIHYTIYSTVQWHSSLNILLGCPSRVELFWKPRKICPSSDIASYVFTLGISAAAKTSITFRWHLIAVHVDWHSILRCQSHVIHESARGYACWFRISRF